MLQLNCICYSTPSQTWKSFNESFKSDFISVVTQEEQLNELPVNDFQQLIDLNDFKFKINHQPCSELSYEPSIIILVHSAPDNFQKRKFIRETWGKKDTQMFLMFLVGSVDSNILQEKMDSENEMHNDLLQGNFHDSYRNMTYKHVMGLKWFVYNCPNINYLLKVDDDAFVNTPLLYNYLSKPSMASEIFCTKFENAVVRRMWYNKWHVTHDEYSGNTYPDYCSGFWILYPAPIVLKLYLEVQKLPYFWIDDIHVTGTTAQKLNISINPSRYLNLDIKDQKNLLNGCLNINEVPFFHAQHDTTEKTRIKLWKIVSGNQIA